ncbi:hypothetical protein CRYUN_Cryun22dG0092500 [Craigia yunnanensis]
MELMKKSDFVLFSEKPKSKRTSLFAIVGSINGAAFVIILIVLVFLGWKCRKAKPKQSSSWPLSLPLYGRGSSYNRMSEKTANMSTSNLKLALRIPYYEIEESTKNFDSNLLIGEGGFGKVYKGLFRAKGLNYLHTGSAGGIIHHDVKSTNILLDEQFVAKVADFGLSKSGLLNVELSVDVKGTFGYLDPEYFISLQLTDESDVYSFGVVLLEVLCARPAVVTSNRREEVNLAEWGMVWLKKGQFEKIIDPMLVDSINPNSLRKFAETTEKCLKPSGSERPIMRDVLWDLEYALQLQITPMNRGPLEDSTTNASLEFSMPVIHRFPSNSFPGVDEEDATVVFDDASDVTANEVFSILRIGEAR